MIRLLARKQKARNFARAFLRVVDINKEGDELLAGILTLLKHYKQESLALHVLELSSAHIDDKCQGICELGKRLHLPESLCLLLQTMARHKEFGLLSHMLPLLQEEIKKIQGVCEVVVTSSHLLESAQKKRVEALVAEHIQNKTLVFFYHIDTSLISGIRIKTSDQYWEDSVARTLRHMRQQLYRQE